MEHILEYHEELVVEYDQSVREKVRGNVRYAKRYSCLDFTSTVESMRGNLGDTLKNLQCLR